MRAHGGDEVGSKSMVKTTLDGTVHSSRSARNWMNSYYRKCVLCYRFSIPIDLFSLLQGENPASYPTVYLVTSPRVWNYKFCPASFWFLYSNDSRLRAMIVEVNNTFDERRLYFLPATDNSRESGYHSSRFRYTWPKDFHVSPFNSRKGKYSLSARDPSQAPTSQNGIIHITATLLSSKSRPKMVTRLWTDKRPIDPFSTTAYQAIRLLFPWCLVDPRIVFEAILLAHRRKLHIWYRPEPRIDTIPRRATSPESYFSRILSAYIQQILLSAPDAFRIHLQSPTHSHNNYVDFSTPTAAETPLAPTIVLTVLTPRFYTILLGHRSMAGVLMSACLDPVVENCTAQACLVTPISVPTDEPRSEKELVGFIARAERSYENRYIRDQNRPAPFLITTLQYLLDWVLAAVRPLRGNLGAVYPHPGLPRLRSEDIRSVTLPADPVDGSDYVTRERELERYFLDDFVRGHYGASQWVWYVAAVVRALIWEGVLRLVGGA
ncbi:hypothetical protein ABOM_006126 [Aspergillus bombycis]|uniref:Uncharacterized protein n=1 Tax=Aspergillus bombycis TaxID=109264 RepID=A0A1F7ZZM8_9EURO|nr:hypothetical protein ABOM_006126 [Aspergillus bombycis]OGM44887.1 hypothetical protein ABOM_006126 [Aspergillus bombycis]